MGTIRTMFISELSILLLFNTWYVIYNPSAQYNVMVGGLSALLIILTSGIIIAVTSGANLAASGFNAVGTSIIFWLVTTAVLVFSINLDLISQNASKPFQIITNILPALGIHQIGLGLCTNFLSSFSVNDLFGFGYYLAVIFGMIVVITSVLTFYEEH